MRKKTSAMPTLNWIGKDKVTNHHLEVPFRTLTHSYGFTPESGQSPTKTDSGNLIIHGDNLEALKALLPRYEGQVDFIYIDPPYNTGEEKWAYNDNVNDPQIRKWLGEIVGKQGEDLTRHDKWLCMMYPRMCLLQKLLSSTGTICISINFVHEHAHLRMLCDEIFGQNNFIGELTWESTTQPINSGSARFNLQQKVEPILFYAKDKTRLPPFVLEEADNGLCYPHQGKYGPCRYEIIEKSNSGEYARPTMQFSILGQRPRKGKRWQIGMDTAQELIRRNRLEIVDGIVKKAIYPEDEQDKHKYVPFWSHLSAKEVGTAQSGKRLLNTIIGRDTGFDTVKPPQLIRELLKHVRKDALVLDSFAGSGTTAQAVLEQNAHDGGHRHFILVESMDYAEDITAERVRRVITGYPHKETEQVEIYSQKLTAANLNHADLLLAKARSVAQARKDDFARIKGPTVKDSCLKVVGENTYEKRMPGTGGAFDYYELGMPLFTDDGCLNNEVGEEYLREYVYYTETRRPLRRKRQEGSGKYLLDTNNDVGYYFYYEKEHPTTLSLNTLDIVVEEAALYVVYADICALPADRLKKLNIVFKQIPRDMKHF